MECAKEKRSEEVARKAATDREGGERVPPAGFLVKRDKLIRQLGTQGKQAGISVICAPDGFGKTALLLQYVSTVQNDPSRGLARLVDVSSLDATELGRVVQERSEELEPALHPLLAVDGVPALDDEATDQLVALLRAVNGRGIEIVLACQPESRSLVKKLDGALKISARELSVQPHEYAEWVHAFSISCSLDVYELTQGVPSLVARLKTATGVDGGCEALGEAAADLYRAVLEPLWRARDPLYRLACFFILMGKGAIADFERSNMRVRSELIGRIERDYPIFGYNAENRSFSCMGVQSAAMASLRSEIAKKGSSFAPKVVRMLMRSDRVDEAVALADELLDTEGSLEVIGQFPTKFAATGNALFVHKVVSRLTVEELVHAPVGAVLAEYLAALTMGEYRTARATCSTLQRRAYVIEQNIDPEVWSVARAFSDTWKECSGTSLPLLSDSYERELATGDAQLLRMHQQIYHELVAGDGNVSCTLDVDTENRSSTNRVDVPRLLLRCDVLLEGVLHGDPGNPVAIDRSLQNVVAVLESRRLAPLAARVRMVAATCRIMAGLPVVDERAFNDAGTVAVRESDLPTQLFCLLGEGWQALALDQLVNARFRAQQVLRLSDGSQGFLQAWAQLLERSAYVLNTSRMTVREEAELIDISEQGSSSAQAWATALHLSAARFDSELSAWFSLNKGVLLDERFCPMARLAMHAIGERAEPIRRLLPKRMASRYLLENEPSLGRGTFFEIPGGRAFAPAGQVSIGLFGGFHVERNGHTVTDTIWKRKKASVLAARLALSQGSFVSRRILTEELWPGTDYGRARENLYVTTSTLRAALGQQDGGPQYLLTQGEGLALNSEFISTDTDLFDLLARDILLKRSRTTAGQIIESCLKMEQLYVGPLYVPDTGDGTYFLRMRRIYLARFIDCMLYGIDVAVADDDLNSASWMVEAALSNDPVREDVIRQAMRVFDLLGRQREVVELYNSHLYYLEHELHAAPDNETRRAYEEIIEKNKQVAMM